MGGRQHGQAHGACADEGLQEPLFAGVRSSASFHTFSMRLWSEVQGRGYLEPKLSHVEHRGLWFGGIWGHHFQLGQGSSGCPLGSDFLTVSH